jgi:hypothetical protein
LTGGPEVIPQKQSRYRDCEDEASGLELLYHSIPGRQAVPMALRSSS